MRADLFPETGKSLARSCSLSSATLRPSSIAARALATVDAGTAGGATLTVFLVAEGDITPEAPIERCMFAETTICSGVLLGGGGLMPTICVILPLRARAQANAYTGHGCGRRPASTRKACKVG